MLRYYKNSSNYNQEIFDQDKPYDIEYFQWLVPTLKEKVMEEKLTSILCQNPIAFIGLILQNLIKSMSIDPAM